VQNLQSSQSEKAMLEKVQLKIENFELILLYIPLLNNKKPIQQN